MRRAGLRNAVVLGVVVLAGLLAGEAGAQVRSPDGVAVIIGNRAYQYDVPEVTYAHRDAEAFRRYVVEVLGFNPEKVIDERDADLATMKRIFGNKDSLTGSELWRHLHPDGRSDVVVFYSGHGMPGLNDKRGYLLPVNAHPDTAQLNGYPIDVLYANLAKLKEQKAVRSVHVFLDACFSGDSGGGRLIASTSAIGVAPLNESEGIATLTILTASSGMEVASWDKAAQHGLFTHHLLDALYGGGDADANGEVTAVEAKAYLDRHMTWAARRLFGRVQNADLRGVETAVLARAIGGRYPDRPEITAGNAKPGAVMEEQSDDAKQGEAVEKHPAERRFRDCPTCPEMVVVPAGSYEMGSLDSEAGRSPAEGPVHRVTLAQPFAVGVYEVMRGEFGRFVESTGYSMENACATLERDEWKKRSGRHWRNPGFKQTDRHPVTCVNWEDAQAYVQWLSQETGREYRLLREAEWEYVARGGSRSRGYRYAGSFAPGMVAWYDENSEGATHPVGQKVPNELGLYDMSGNVWEWVEDCWNGRYKGAPGDGRAWENGDCSKRVLRGGAWGSIPRYLRTASRSRNDPGIRGAADGFRVARTLTDGSTTLPAAGRQRDAEARQQAEEARREAESLKSLLASLDRQMITVQGGTFTMGCTKEQGDCLKNEKPAHRVQVRSFEISPYEVTQALWEAVMGENPSKRKCPRCPVTGVSWNDIQAFLKKLNALAVARYRLPAEAEWEYAARGGTRSRGYKYPGSHDVDSVAWHEKNSGGVVQPVGQKVANELGLYDMSGNAVERVQDCWHENYVGAPVDGKAWENGNCSLRVLRSDRDGPRFMRSAARIWYGTGNAYVDPTVGFRLARTLD